MSRAAGDRIREACITVLGSGHAPFASGSWGSLAALVIFVLLWVPLGAAGLSAGARDLILTVPGIAIACVLSVAWGRWALERFDSKDPKPFVLDEFAGQWVSLLVLPPVIGDGWLAIAAVFAGQLFLFRVFDVLKPPPAAQLERLPEGWGVLCDDLMAGVYANLAGQALWRLSPAAAWIAAVSS